MYTTKLLSLIAQTELKKGKRHRDCWYTNGIMYRFTVIMHLLSHSTDGRKGGKEGSKRQTQYRKDSSVWIWTPFAVEPMLCYSLRKRQRDGNECARAHTGMNSVSAEPNVRPIKVYWDQVVLVSLEVEADLFNQTWGWVWWYWWQWWASWVVGFSAPLMVVVVVSVCSWAWLL